MCGGGRGESVNLRIIIITDGERKKKCLTNWREESSIINGRVNSNRIGIDETPPIFLEQAHSS